MFIAWRCYIPVFIWLLRLSAISLIISRKPTKQSVSDMLLFRTLFYGAMHHKQTFTFFCHQQRLMSTAKSVLFVISDNFHVFTICSQNANAMSTPYSDFFSMYFYSLSKNYLAISRNSPHSNHNLTINPMAKVG